MFLLGLFALLLTLIVGLVYAFWIRPMLRARPSFKELYDREDSLWGACSSWAGGIKQKLTTVIVVSGGSVVSIYDFIAPLISQAGVDVTKITDRVPSWAWPLLTMALLGLVQCFRNLGDKQVAMSQNVEKVMDGSNSDGSAS